MKDTLASSITVLYHKILASVLNLHMIVTANLFPFLKILETRLPILLPLANEVRGPYFIFFPLLNN